MLFGSEDIKPFHNFLLLQDCNYGEFAWFGNNSIGMNRKEALRVLLLVFSLKVNLQAKGKRYPLTLLQGFYIFSSTQGFRKWTEWRKYLENVLMRPIN